MTPLNLITQNTGKVNNTYEYFAYINNTNINHFPHVNSKFYSQHCQLYSKTKSFMNCVNVA